MACVGPWSCFWLTAVLVHLQFGTINDDDGDEDGLSMDEASSTTIAKTDDGDVTSEHGTKDAGFDNEKTADVVSLDTFRKRPTN